MVGKPGTVTPKVSFVCDRWEHDIITVIADRAFALAAKLGRNAPVAGWDRIAWQMDFTATHCNGTPLRLMDLANADDTNFAHDAFGIWRHLDRDTGKLGGCFVPRYAKPENQP